jgi:hypothetical protein
MGKPLVENKLLVDAVLPGQPGRERYQDAAGLLVRRVRELERGRLPDLGAQDLGPDGGPCEEFFELGGRGGRAGQVQRRCLAAYGRGADDTGVDDGGLRREQPGDPGRALGVDGVGLHVYAGEPGLGDPSGEFFGGGWRAEAHDDVAVVQQLCRCGHSAQAKPLGTRGGRGAASVRAPQDRGRVRRCAGCDGSAHAAGMEDADGRLVPAGPAPDGWNGINQGHELSDVVAVAAGEDDCERCAVPVGDQVVLGAGPSPIDRRRVCLEPPFNALTWLESTTARDQSSRAAAFSFNAYLMT